MCQRTYELEEHGIIYYLFIMPWSGQCWSKAYFCVTVTVSAVALKASEGKVSGVLQRGHNVSRTAIMDMS